MALAEGWQVGIGGVLATVLAWSLAGLIYFLQPDRATNRWLALLLFAEGATAIGGVGLGFFTTDLATQYAFQAITYLAYDLIAPIELAFLGTLAAPLARPFARRSVRAALALYAALVIAAFFLLPRLFMFPDTGAGPLQYLLFVLSSLVHVYALAVSLSALRAARDATSRRRARAYTVAFGIRNVGLLLVIGGTFLPRYGLAINIYGYQIVANLFILAVAYAILKTQLFDVDLRIKRGISRGTVVAVFAAVFFAASEGAANLVETRTGSALVGIGAASLLVLALAPVQRLADSVAERAMPHVHPTPEYLSYRKLEVYKAALEGAMQDGEVSDKERDVLRRLRTSLGISDADADAMERDLGARA